jgi:hypothetical protein
MMVITEVVIMWEVIAHVQGDIITVVTTILGTTPIPTPGETYEVEVEESVPRKLAIEDDIITGIFPGFGYGSQSLCIVPFVRPRADENRRIV